MVLFKEAYDELRKAWIVFIGSCYKKLPEHGVENDPDLEEKVVFDRPDIDDILLN